MSKKRILVYWISKLGYERPVKDYSESLHKWYISYRQVEYTKSFRKAKEWARKIGSGAIIRRISQTRSGKTKIKEWEYIPEE